jgi:hypothetical protein
MKKYTVTVDRKVLDKFVSGYSHTTSSSSTASSGGMDQDFGPEDEARLRDYISQLKVRPR